MKHKRLKLGVLFLLIFGLTELQAQEAILATGSNASGSGGLASYSVGQVVYQIHTGASGSIAEGVQQPYEISVVTGLTEAKGINLSVFAYPNPAANYLIVRVDEFDISDLSYQLFDINGKLLQNEKIATAETRINMNDLLPAIYFVKIIRSDKELKAFKIIKTQ